MSSTSFELIPHQAGIQAGAASNCSLQGQLSVVDTTLQITYQLEGKLSQLMIPGYNSRPLRQHCLWQATCLEFFLAAAGNSDYWEYNLSPGGDWNVYHLNSYRKGLAKEPAYKQLPFNVIRNDKQLSLSLTCALPPALATPIVAAALEIGVCAVLQSSSGALTYWAVAHPGSEPDFHHSEGFCLKLT